MKSISFLLNIFEKVGIDALSGGPIVITTPSAFFNVVSKCREKQYESS